MTELRKAISELKHELVKARIIKYIKRIPKAGGGYKYIYKETEKKTKKIDQTQTPEFKKWFGNSKVVDKNGKPLVVYHGTKFKFNKFKNINDKREKRILFFSESKDYAKNYAKNEENSYIFSVYLSIKNPINLSDLKMDGQYTTYGEIVKKLLKNNFSQDDIDYIFGDYDEEEEIYPWEMFDAESGLDDSNEMIKKLIDKGFDGIILPSSGHGYNVDIEYGVIKPTQIKSATRNRGTFDPNNSDMTKAIP